MGIDRQPLDLGRDLVRFVRGQDPFDAFGEVGPGRLCLDAGVRGEEVDFAQCVEFALQLALKPDELGRFHGGQAAVGVLPARAKVSELRAPVEELAIRRVLVARAGDDLHQPGATSFADAFVGKALQRLLALRARGRQVRAVPQRHAAEGLQGAPDAHARGRAARRQRDDEQQPHG